MILYLVRHGETTFNAEGRVQGQLDTPLSALGHRQGHAVVSAFHDVPIDAIYSSPLSRARETAQAAADLLRLPLVTDDRLMEVNAGVFQGHTWPEISAQWPDAAVAWKAQDPDFCIPQGESRRALMLRAKEIFEHIRQQPFQHVLVIAHGGVLTAALKALINVPAERNPFSLYNGSISMVDWTAQFRLLTLNQLDHLRAEGLELRSRTGDL
jgi:probable phosphoglycerate mutase